MAPPKSRINSLCHQIVPEDIIEMKTSVEFIGKQIDDISNVQNEVSQILSFVTKLHSVIQEKDKKIQQLEERIDSLEQYSRKDNPVITGLKNKDRTWVRVASCNAKHANELENASDDEMQNLEKQVVTFLNTKLGTCIESSDISACHPIRNKASNKPDNVIVRFINTKSKIELLIRAMTLKGTNIYINEHLTTKKCKLACTTRILQRRQNLKNWTSYCKIYIKSLGSPKIA